MLRLEYTRELGNNCPILNNYRDKDWLLHLSPIGFSMELYQLCIWSNSPPREIVMAPKKGPQIQKGSIDDVVTYPDFNIKRWLTYEGSVKSNRHVSFEYIGSIFQKNEDILMKVGLSYIYNEIRNTNLRL